MLKNELPIHVRHHRRPKKWVICCIGSDLPITTFAPAIPFPACLAVYLRTDISHYVLNPSFVIISERQTGNLHLRFISIHVFWLPSRFLFPEAVSDLNMTFGKLRVTFQFSQPFQHPHVNLFQPCGFFMEFLICCSSTVSYPSLQNVLIYLEVEVEAQFSFEDQLTHGVLCHYWLLHPATDLHFPQLSFAFGKVFLAHFPPPI